MIVVEDGVDEERERQRAEALEASRREFERLIEEERASAPKRRIIPLNAPLDDG